MCESPDWLPPLVRLSDYGGDWNRYIDEVFAVFYADFIQSQPQFTGCWVRCRRDPLHEGKEAGFWHCVQEGADEEQRTPDLRRCERVGWIRAIIEHAGETLVDHWTNRRGSDTRHLLWFREEYLVVMGERVRRRDGFRYFQLITAYVTEEEHRKRNLRRERDAARNG